MKATHVALAVLVLLLCAGAAHAYNIQMSWYECNGWYLDEAWNGPGWHRIIVAAQGMPPGVFYSGHDTEIHVWSPDGPLPDAWRFDVGGCEGSARLYPSYEANGPCRVFQGPNAVAEATFVWERYVTGTATLRVACSFDPIDTPPPSAYTLFAVTFDMRNTTYLPSTSGLCGDATQDVWLIDTNTEILGAWSGYWYKADNTPWTFGHGPSSDPRLDMRTGNYLTWSASFAARGSTWGRLKGMYR